MHITELTPELIAKLKEYIEINSEGHILTKKKNITQSNQPDDHKLKQFSGNLMRVGDTRTKVGKRRGMKTKHGQVFSFNFPVTKERLTCKAREIVWVFNNGTYDPKMKVQPKNGDLFDDRIENLHLVKGNNGRPVGAKDKIKRQNRHGLTAKEDNQIVKLRKRGYTKNQIAKKLNFSKCTVDNSINLSKKSGNLKPFINAGVFESKADLTKEEMGVYVIYASPLDSENYISKGYIGSSRSSKNRLKTHFRDLKNGKHYNRGMQAAYDSGNYVFQVYWIKKGDFAHGEALALETEHINKYERASLFNMWSQPPLEVIKPFLDKAKSKISEENYTVDENGCWNWKAKHVSGYSKEMQVWIDGKIKYIKTLTLSYYKHRGEYPELVRHMCDNKACINPKCLQKGSHQQNGLDKSRQFRKEFEYWWLRYEGDIEKLTNHFDFKKNQDVGSSQIYYWERQLGLREKYPDLWYARSHLLAPGERTAKQVKKEQKQQQKKDRQDHVESLRATAHNLARRYDATKTDVAKLLRLTFQEASSLMSDVEPLNYNAVWKISEPCGDYENRCLYAPEMMRNFPDLKRDIEDCYAREIFRDEWEACRNFLWPEYK